MSHKMEKLVSTVAAAMLGLSTAAHATGHSPTVVHVDLMDPSTDSSVRG